MDYLDFELAVRSSHSRRYPVEVRSPAGEAQGTMLFPFAKRELEKQLHAVQNALIGSLVDDPPASMGETDNEGRGHRAHDARKIVQDFGQARET